MTDEIKRAAEANKALKAQNQETIPVWKQLVSSIFSWQTAMMVAITVMSMCGKEIVSWISNLFKAKDATEDMRIEQEKFNKAMSEARDSAAKEIANLRVLYSQMTNVNLSMNARLAAVEKLQKQYPAYFGNLSKEQMLAGETSAAYRQLAKDIMIAARARAAQERIEALAARQLQEQRGANADKKYLDDNRTKAVEAKAFKNENERKLRERYGDDTSSPAARAFAAESYSEYRKRYGDTLEEYDIRAGRLERHEQKVKSLEKQMQSYTGYINQAADAMARLDGFTTQNDKNVGRDDKSELEEQLEIRKKAQEKLDKDLLSLQQKNQDDEISLMRDGTEKKLAEIDNDYKKRIAEIEKQEAEFKEKNKEAGITGLGVNGLTKEQQNALQEAADNAAKERERQTNEVYAAEAQAMRDYLKQYGTFQQQKLAIAEEYAEKISKAQNEGERLSLTAERDRAVQQVEINAIKQNIDWGSVFGDFGTMFKEQLQPTIDQLRKIAGSDTFRQSSLEEQQVLYELIEKLENANAAWDSDIFKRVSDDIKAYQEAMRGYAAAVDKVRIAEEKLADAQSTLDAAKRGGLSQEIINAAQVAVDEAQEAFNAASEEVTNFGAQVQETTTSLNSSATEAKAMFEGLAEGLRGLSSGSLQGIGQGVMSLDKLFGGNITKDAGNALAKGFQSLLGKDSQAAKTLSEALGNSGLAGEIISAILGMLDILAEGGVGGIVSNLADTVLGSVNGILDDIFSGGIITKPMQSLVDGVGGILDTITFGGLSSWLGGNDSEVMETVNRLTESNEYLRESIDRLKERIDESAGGQAINYYEKAAEAETEWQENQREIIKNLASAWTNTGYGFLGLSGKGSFNSHSPGDSWEGWDSFTKTLRENGFNITIDEVGDLWELTPEQMALLRDNNPKEWQKLFSGDGHKNPLDEVNEYIEHAGELEGLMETLNENLTQTSFDSLRSSFLDTLMDMESDAQDFTDDFSSMMQRALLNYAMGDVFDQSLKQWYNSLSDEIRNSGGDWSSIDIGKYRDEWQVMADEWLGVRDAISEITGYTGNASDSGQQASSKGYEVASQESVDYTNGRLNAIYEAELRIEAQGEAKGQSLADLKGSVAEIAVQAQGLYGIADETRSILANSYLELQEIRENTAEIVKPIKKIQKDIEQVKQNTSKL